MNYLRAMLGVSNILNDSFMPMKKVFLGLLLVSLIIGLIVYMLSWNLKRSTLKTYNQNVVTAPYDVIIVPGIPYDTGHQNILLKVRLFWAKNLFDKGINAVITSQRAIPANLMDPKIKNRSRIFYLMANIEASQFAGEDNWALLLDTSGYISEGTGDNFFILKDNVVITPEGRDILRGISREYVMKELCPQLGLTILEKNIEPYDVYTADEAFMTGTPFCMLPVTRLNGLAIGDGKVGHVFNSILQQWSKNTGVNIAEQIKTWNKIDGASSGDAPTPYSFKTKSK